MSVIHIFFQRIQKAYLLCADLGHGQISFYAENAGFIPFSKENLREPKSENEPLSVASAST